MQTDARRLISRTATSLIRHGEVGKGTDIARFMNPDTKVQLELQNLKRDMAAPILYPKNRKEIADFRARLDSNLSDFESTQVPAEFHHLKPAGIDTMVTAMELDKLQAWHSLFCLGQYKVYLFRQDEESRVRETQRSLSDIDQRLLESTGDQFRFTNESLGWIRSYHLAEGRLLGFPECCVTSFTEQKIEAYKEVISNPESESKEPEYTGAQSNIETGSLGFLIDNVDKIPSLLLSELHGHFYSRFAYAFIPCRPTCQNAIALGKHNEQSMDPELRPAYRAVLIYNTFRDIVDMYRGVVDKTGRFPWEKFPEVSKKKRDALGRLAEKDSQSTLAYWLRDVERLAA